MGTAYENVIMLLIKIYSTLKIKSTVSLKYIVPEGSPAEIVINEFDQNMTQKGIYIYIKKVT